MQKYNAQSRIRARRINNLVLYIYIAFLVTGFLKVSEMDYEDHLYRTQGVIAYSNP